MADETESTHANLSPDEAFGLLGNDVRVDILQTLGDAGESLSFPK